MVPKSLVPALLAVAVLASGSASAADYRPSDFLTLDLSKAVFSKTPLGPPTEFAPVAVEAKGDRSSEVTWARETLKAEPKQVRTRIVRAAHPHRITHVARETRHGVARVRLAHRRPSNPLDAQAMDTRIQTWPCRSGGGICDWRR
jgi:hypothetical protein